MGRLEAKENNEIVWGNTWLKQPSTLIREKKIQGWLRKEIIENNHPNYGLHHSSIWFPKVSINCLRSKSTNTENMQCLLISGLMFTHEPELPVGWLSLALTWAAAICSLGTKGYVQGRIHLHSSSASAGTFDAANSHYLHLQAQVWTPGQPPCLCGQIQVTRDETKWLVTRLLQLRDLPKKSLVWCATFSLLAKCFVSLQDRLLRLGWCVQDHILCRYCWLD